MDGFEPTTSSLRTVGKMSYGKAPQSLSYFLGALNWQTWQTVFSLSFQCSWTVRSRCRFESDRPVPDSKEVTPASLFPILGTSRPESCAVRAATEGLGHKKSGCGELLVGRRRLSQQTLMRQPNQEGCQKEQHYRNSHHKERECCSRARRFCNLFGRLIATLPKDA